MDGDLAGFIEHTLLRADARASDVATLCDEARAHRFAGVCVNPVHVARCAARLAGSGVRVVTVVGFPLGAHETAVKVLEAERAAEAGADELDMVLRVDALLDGDDDAVAADVRAVVRAVAPRSVKVILETALLDDARKVRGCELAGAAGAAFVKTSTGFGPGGATVADVRLMRSVVGDALGVKASGGIRDATTARAMIAAGASRIGTSSGVALAGEDRAPTPMQRRGQ